MTLGDELIYDDGWKVGDLRALRRDKIGFVFQAPYLIPFLDVTDNVALLPMLAGVRNAESRTRALELLAAGTDKTNLIVEKHRYRGPDGRNATVSIARFPE